MIAGDLLRSNDGQWIPVTSVKDTGEEVAVFNVRVEQFHTYFVGSEEWGFSVWAHNWSCWHGTDMVSAQDIVENGINGLGDFYVTFEQDFAEMSAMQAAQEAGGTPAVIQFNIPNQITPSQLGLIPDPELPATAMIVPPSSASAWNANATPTLLPPR